MAILPTDIRILFTNDDIMTYFLNLVSCSTHFISMKHRILATFNINKRKSILTACMPLTYYNILQLHNSSAIYICMLIYKHIRIPFPIVNLGKLGK